MTQNHPRTAVMIDLETMSTAKNALITSIGAVLFDPLGDWIGDTLHLHIDGTSAQQSGAHVEFGTVLWWMSQSDAARAALVHGQLSAIALPDALTQLERFIPEEAEVWCNGASFDFPILDSAYRSVDRKQPWKYHKERCLRSLKGIYPSQRLTHNGTPHNALDDAIHQARLVQHLLQFNRDEDA